jgi:hypothetical protein
LAEHVAAIGMQQLDKESFLRDCTVLLDETRIGGALAQQCCTVLTAITPRDIDLIESYLGSSGELARCAEALKRHERDDQPALAAASDLWDNWLRARLTTKLQAIEGTDPLMSTPFPLPPKIR